MFAKQIWQKAYLAWFYTDTRMNHHTNNCAEKSGVSEKVITMLNTVTNSPLKIFKKTEGNIDLRCF